MHLVYMIDSLASGGAQRQAVELALELRAHSGVRVDFVVYRAIDFYAERLRAGGLSVTHIPKPWKFDPRLPLRLRRWLRTARPDVLHAFLPWPCLWSYLAVRALPARERPALVAAERSACIATTWSEALLQRLVYRGSDAVTANARSVRDEIVRKLGVPAERAHYLPNGIHLAHWDRAAESPCPLPLEEERFELALVGGLRREKNHRLVLEALERLGSERIRSWRVWFIGAATHGAAFADSIRREIARRGLDGVVRIEPATTDIASVMRQLDGVLLPSAFEGFPNVALEAMASRVPVVASSVGDVPNLIENGRTGLVLGEISAEALAKAMAALEELGEEGRRAMGARARAAVEERFEMGPVARRYLALYREVAAARSGGEG